MEITAGLFIFLVLIAFFSEFIDSSLGMGYGTILSPVLLIIGFNPLVAVPAILITQAFGGLAASIFHHRFRNVSFSPDSRDLKVVLVISGLGIIATIIAALLSIKIPAIILKTYISVLVLIMGIIILLNKKFSFSWKKMVGIGVLSAFNKGISGGGFGPVVTAGQIMAGEKYKSAIGITTLAEAPICIASFLTYFFARVASEFKGSLFSTPLDEFLRIVFSPKMLNGGLILALLIGSVLVAPFGAFTTRKINDKYMHLILGIFIVTLGVWSLVSSYRP